MEPFDTIEELRRKDDYDESDITRLRALTNSNSNVADLWDFLGDVIHLVHFATGADVPSAEPLTCYQNAIKCDPSHAKAHESIGYYRDLFDEWDDSEKHFRLAIKCGGGDSALIGLARVLEQLGRHADAQNVLNDCIDQEGAKLVELRSEIDDGLWIPDAR